jgi:uncharacterized membrane protein HdeD (DUF308 family)
MTRPSKQSLRLFLGSLGVAIGVLAAVLFCGVVSNAVVKVVVGGVCMLVGGGFLLVSIARRFGEHL